MQYLLYFEKIFYSVHRYMKGQSKHHQACQRLQLRSLMAVHIQVTNNRADADKITQTITGSMVHPEAIEETTDEGQGPRSQKRLKATMILSSQ